MTVFSAQLKRLNISRILVKRNPHKLLTSVSSLIAGPSMGDTAVYSNLLLVLTKCSRRDVKALSTSVQITRIKKKKSEEHEKHFPFSLSNKEYKKKKERDNACTKSQLLLPHEALTHQRPTVETPRDRCERSCPFSPRFQADLSFYTPK